MAKVELFVDLNCRFMLGEKMDTNIIVKPLREKRHLIQDFSMEILSTPPVCVFVVFLQTFSSSSTHSFAFLSLSTSEYVEELLSNDFRNEWGGEEEGWAVCLT